MNVTAPSNAYAALQFAPVPSAGNEPVSFLPDPSEAPDFAAIRDVRQKKQAFFSFMLPLVREENKKITDHRNEILNLRNRLLSGAKLAGGDHQRLEWLFTHYKLKAPAQFNVADLEALLNRVDVVPASLVLAQAANESGWGTSRFATEANNYFGIWCFKAGCGVVPQHRSSGKNHEVARYNSAGHSVAAYMRNINTHRAYRDLRRIRAGQRDLQRHIAGRELAEGLRSYSERGEEYVREIQLMIRINNLEAYTEETQA